MKRFFSQLLRLYCVLCAILLPLTVAGVCYFLYHYAWKSGSSARNMMLAEPAGLYLLEEGPEARGKRFQRLVLNFQTAGKLQHIKESEVYLMCGAPDETRELPPDARVVTYNYSATPGVNSYANLVFVKGVLESIGYNVRGH